VDAGGVPVRIQAGKPMPGSSTPAETPSKADALTVTNIAAPKAAISALRRLLHERRPRWHQSERITVKASA